MINFLFNSLLTKANLDNSVIWVIKKNDSLYETEDYIFELNNDKIIRRDEKIKSDDVLKLNDIESYAYISPEYIYTVSSEDNSFSSFDRSSGLKTTYNFSLIDIDENKYKFNSKQFNVLKRYLDKKGGILLNSTNSSITFEGYSIGYFGNYTIEKNKDIKFSVRMDITGSNNIEFNISITPNFTINCKVNAVITDNKDKITESTSDLITIYKGTTYKFNLK